MSPVSSARAVAPVQHLAAVVVAAAADQRQPAAEVVRLARPRGESPDRAAAPTSGRTRGSGSGTRTRAPTRPSSCSSADARWRSPRGRPRPRRARRSRRRGSATQSQSTLPALLLTSSARWPIAKRGVQPMPRMPWSSRMSASCSSRNSSSVSHAWPGVVRDVLARVLADRAGAGRLLARRVLRAAGPTQVRRHQDRASSSATHSTCGVCGNMSTGRARTRR